MSTTKGFHVSEYIQDEIDARGWSREELALRMCGEGDEPYVTLLALDLLMDVHDTRVRLHEQAEQLAMAFGSSAETWIALHDAWLEANGATKGCA